MRLRNSLRINMIKILIKLIGKKGDGIKIKKRRYKKKILKLNEGNINMMKINIERILGLNIK